VGLGGGGGVSLVISSILVGSVVVVAVVIVAVGGGIAGSSIVIVIVITSLSLIESPLCHSTKIITACAILSRRERIRDGTYCAKESSVCV